MSLTYVCLYFFNALDNVFTPLSSSSLSSDLEDQSYSPSLLENSVPIRSKSEMSHRMPLNKEWHGGVVRNFKDIFELPITKSKSSENVFNNTNDTQRSILKKDVKLTKSLNDYRLKVAKEDNLRQEIIKELLADTHLIRNPQNLKSELGFERKIFELPVMSNQIGDKMDEIDDDFLIPVLPSGKMLLLHILNTWGDKYYVGLNGIEIFADTGELVQVKKVNFQQFYRNNFLKMLTFILLH